MIYCAIVLIPQPFGERRANPLGGGPEGPMALGHMVATALRVIHSILHKTTPIIFN